MTLSSVNEGLLLVHDATTLLIMGVIWFCTWLWQVPAHRRLEHGFDAATHRRLMRTNWVRTIAWSARGILTLVLIVVPRS